MTEIKRALISVWDKEGVVEIAGFLHENNIEIISTGGTSRIINDANIPTIDVSDISSQKEIMNGRVKTLHPSIFGGILADRDNPLHINDLSDMKALSIDIVIINLYPFKSEAVEKNLDLKKAIEFIDIGGPSMLRAAAKNFQYVIPICHSSQYSKFIHLYNENNGVISIEDRASFAKEVFSLTLEYDIMINKYFQEKSKNINEINLGFIKNQELRYGENPHQQSSFYLHKGKNTLFKQLHGKQLSYNNYFDIESAISIVYEFDDLACSIIKHSNPCGFGKGENNLKAYQNAVSTDPVSFFGGIVAFNHKVDFEVAKEVNKSFLECIVAPLFSKEALTILKAKKNLRLIEIDKERFISNYKNNMFRSVFNGILFQQKDGFIKNEKNFEVVTIKKPTEKEFNALLLGWKLVKFVKSNAIVFNDDKRLLGVGAGQMSRIDSAKIAISKAEENNLDLNGSIMASDAFFPFPDCVELAAKKGVSCIIQPGGSIKDEEIINTANRLNISMILTRERHFYH